jgi:photosystem II stability/assembly factor-like uncharacterized protein
MTKSRYDQIWEAWKLSVEAAQKPEAPPLPAERVRAASTMRRRAGFSPRRVQIAALVGVAALIAAVVILPVAPWSSHAASTGNPQATPSSPGPTTSPIPATPTPTISTAPASAYLSGMVGLRGNAAWDLTDTGLFVSEDGGRTWSSVALPAGLSAPTLGTTTSGTVVTAVANRAVWLAVREGDGYRIYTRLESTAGWTSTLLVPTWPVQSVSGPPESVIVTPGPGGLLTVAEWAGMAMSSAVTELFVSTDNGLTFTPHPPPANSGAWEYWRSVAFVGPKVGVVVMGSATSDVSTMVYTTDGGTAWKDSSVAGLPAAGWRAFGTPTIVGSDIVVPATTWTDGAKGPENIELRLLMSHDAGASFAAVGTALQLGADFGPTTATTGDSTWAMTVTGGVITIFETQDRGATWSTIRPAGLSLAGYFLELAGPGRATILTTDSGCPGKTNCWTHVQLLATTDAGRTWSPVVSAWPGSTAPTPTPTAGPTSILTGTPRPGDEAAATAFVTRFETLISQQDFANAWPMLSPEDRARNTYPGWVAALQASLKSSGPSFKVGPASHDWQSWGEPDPDWLPRNYPGDYGRAFIFGVSDASSPQNGGSELMVLPSASGAWEIVVLR